MTSNENDLIARIRRRTETEDREMNGLAPVATRQRTNPATSPYTFSAAFSSTAPPSELVCG